MGKSKKGGAWEREICGDLSRWWSGDDDTDDWFWRASQSGGRATTRARKGKTTAGHCGDVAATCRQGEGLTKAFAIELKRGYGKGGDTAMPHVMLDRPNGAAQQTFEAWVQQAEESRRNAGAFGWWLCYRRDRRKAVLFTERRVERALIDAGAQLKKFRPFLRATLETTFKILEYDNKGKPTGRFFAVPYKLVAFDMYEFLELVRPEDVKALLRKVR